MVPLDLNIRKEPVLYGNPAPVTGPMVSVCVTTYRHTDFIEKCILSILSQKTTFPIEIIIGEDDSPDGTRDKCMALADAHPDRISLILHHRENVIEILGRKTGRFNFLFNLSKARGKYIALCDGDDYWTDPLKLQKQVDILEGDSGYAISAHAVQELRGESHSIPDGHPDRPERNNILDLAEGNFIHTASCMYKRPAQYPDWLRLTSAGDYPLHLWNAQQGDIHFINEPMAVYRRHDGGIWSSQSNEDTQMRWIHLLLSIYPHFKIEVQQVLLERIKYYMAQRLGDDYTSKEAMDIDFLHANFKAKDLLKALLLKFRR